MKGRKGTKKYDTDKSTLITTLPDGMQVYRKRGRSIEFFLYNPAGTVSREKFFDLPPEEAMKYIPENTKSKQATQLGNTIRFKPYDLERIRQHAIREGLPINRFVLMLVDEYERRHHEV